MLKLGHMKKILAISGGLDSMVLLHQFRHDPDVIIAHFNHGTRPSADDDQKFVGQAAADYRLPFETENLSLGATVSEAAARAARYQFLFRLADQYNHAVIYTAHHANDVLESIAINLLRGTGWRGLAPLNHPRICRPLLTCSQADLHRYAATHQIIFRQDPTNFEDAYLRNRLRPLLAALSPAIQTELLGLYYHQIRLKSDIAALTEELLPSDQLYYRSWFINLPDPVALELLRFATRRSGFSLTRPQIQDFLIAIRTYLPGKFFNLPDGQLIKIHQKYFQLPARP